MGKDKKKTPPPEEIPLRNFRKTWFILFLFFIHIFGNIVQCVVFLWKTFRRNKVMFPLLNSFLSSSF